MSKEDYLKAGSIAAKVLEKAVKRVEVGLPLIELAELVDREIENSDGVPAFPVNISIDDAAAHFTPGKDEKAVFEEGQMVKIDLGVAVNGFPADTAATVDLGNDEKLKEASEAALAAAIEIVSKDVTLDDIGSVIENEIVKRGFRPIVNLTGHSMEKNNLHSGISIPNYSSKDRREIGNGLFAIEPFATKGDGKVKNSEPSQIYRVVSKRIPRLPRLRRLRGEILERFGTFPFAARWVDDEFALKMLCKQGIVHNYPVLREITGEKVSQAEKSILIDGEEIIVTT